jgi:hypothetical protein
MADAMARLTDDQVIQIAREAIARMKDADDAPHSARLVREGAWDDVTEVKIAIIAARAVAAAVNDPAA